jgi:hypothetical protein
MDVAQVRSESQRSDVRVRALDVVGPAAVDGMCVRGEPTDFPALRLGKGKNDGRSGGAWDRVAVLHGFNGTSRKAWSIGLFYIMQK